LFDFLTTTTGLFARASLPNLANPVQSFPLYAEKILGSGMKGIFYAAMFATIISTLNSFIFLSATTFGRDFVFKLKKNSAVEKIPSYTRVGLLVTALISILIAYFVQSVITIWYLIGSICIPGIIFLVFGAYYERIRISKNFAITEIIGGVASSVIWFFVREKLNSELLQQIEPMIAGLLFVFVVHLIGIINFRQPVSSS